MTLSPFLRLTLALTTLGATTFAQTVLVKPYVQPGNGVSLEGTDVKVIAWLTDQIPGEFTVEFGPKGGMAGKAKAERVSLDFAAAKPVAPPATPAPAAKSETNKLSGAATTIEEFKAKVVKESSPVLPEKVQPWP